MAARPDPKSDIPQGTIDLLVLKAVSLGPLHGYGIAQRLQQLSRDVIQVQQGTLYPALHRLENRGLARLRVERIGHRPRGEVLQAHPQGPRQLSAEQASWQRLSDAVGLILAEPEGEPP